METKGQYIKRFKDEHPVVDCLGQGNGRWKWRRYLDGIDLRYGKSTKKAAEMERSEVAKEEWIRYEYANDKIKCPKCGKNTTNQVLEALNMCQDCSDRKFADYQYE